MWFTLTRGQTATLDVHNRQSVWRASDTHHAKLVVTAYATLHEQVTVASPQVVRLAYQVLDAQGTLTLGDSKPGPWVDAAQAKGESFEIMLTPKGAVMAPRASALPNRVLAWLNTLAEDVRAAWPAIPKNLVPHQTWTGANPLVLGGLPPNAKKGTLDLNYRATRVEAHAAEVEARYQLYVSMDEKLNPTQAAVGHGTMRLKLLRQSGPTEALRTNELTLHNLNGEQQSVRTVSELTRRATEQLVTLPTPLDDEQTPPSAR